MKYELEMSPLDLFIRSLFSFLASLYNILHNYGISLIETRSRLKPAAVERTAAPAKNTMNENDDDSEINNTEDYFLYNVPMFSASCTEK